MAQQAPDQNAQAPDQTPPPPPGTPAGPTGAPATMQTVTVTGSRPSEDFQSTKTSIFRLGADNVMDIPQTVVIINKALMQSQAVTTLEGAVRNVAGVTIGSAEGGNIGNNITSTASRPAPTSISTACATAASTIVTSSRWRRSRSLWARPRCCSAAARPAASSIR